ncbi:hypothetical protein [Listeria ilorinensis]|uniref:hypothetical protein n=1 Tax=Listeria ilorinensis TaxID=2867439 RepID=UPI001EF73147|nr:hypothetical protein [Listeria ilorinensis]
MKNSIVEYTMITIGASLALIGVIWLGTALSITGIRVLTGTELTLITGGSNIVVIFIMIYFLLAVCCCCIGFITTFQLYKNETKLKKWGILLIISGVLSLWGFGLATGVLFLTAGIRMLFKLAEREQH